MPPFESNPHVPEPSCCPRSATNPEGMNASAAQAENTTAIPGSTSNYFTAHVKCLPRQRASKPTGVAGLLSQLWNSAGGAGTKSNPKTSTKAALRVVVTSLRAIETPISSRDVTLQLAMPQGVIRSKKLKSAETLYANPWDVTQRLMCTPIAASFAGQDR